MTRDDLEVLTKIFGAEAIVGILELPERDDKRQVVEDMMSDVLGSICGEFLGSDETEKQIAHEVADLVKKWLDIETYPPDPKHRRDREDEAELTKNGLQTFAIIARALSMIHMVTSASVAAAFLSAPRSLEQPIAGLIQKSTFHAIEQAQKRAAAFKRNSRAAKKAEREAEAAAKHPAAAESGPTDEEITEALKSKPDSPS